MQRGGLLCGVVHRCGQDLDTLWRYPELEQRVAGELPIRRKANAARAQPGLGRLLAALADQHVGRPALMVEVHRFEPSLDPRAGQHKHGVRWLERIFRDQVTPGKGEKGPERHGREDGDASEEAHHTSARPLEPNGWHEGGSGSRGGGATGPARRVRNAGVSPR